MEEENCSLGYIKLFRSLLGWEWFDDSKTLHVFVYCLLRAGYKDATWKGINLKPGEFIGSRAQIAEKTRLTDSEVKTALMHLEKTGEIARKKAGKFTIYKVKNYSSYQQIADITPEKRRQIADITPEKPPKDKKERSKEVKNYLLTNCETAPVSHEKKKMIATSFPESSDNVRQLLEQLYDRFEQPPTASTLKSWREALDKCQSDKERIRMIQYSLGGNKHKKVYKRLYPDRGLVGDRKGTPDWYDKIPAEPSTPESLEEARRLREEILGGK